MLEYKGAIRKDGIYVGRLTELKRKEIPHQLSEPAAGKFPVIEEALQANGLAVPADWSVGTMIVAVAVATTTMLRIDEGLPPEYPKETMLILDNRHLAAGEPSRRKRYELVDFRIKYSDGNVWHGSSRMPHSRKDADNLAGIPIWFDDTPDNTPSKSPVSPHDRTLIDRETKRFTPLGRWMTSYIGGIIQAQNDTRQYMQAAPEAANV